MNIYKPQLVAADCASASAYPTVSW